MGITSRRYTPSCCLTFPEHTPSTLIVQCGQCDRSFATCCPETCHSREDKTPCHQLQLVFVDGACSNNGQVNARAGLGITMGGAGDDLSWSIRVDEDMDPGATRTNNRAELLAAIEGLKKIHETELGLHAKLSSHGDGTTYIIVSDSSYVVRGITEYFYSWKKNNWRTSKNKTPSNFDLFLRLDAYATKLEDQGIEVEFWHVPRAHNHKADVLARRAAAVAL